MHYTNIPNHSAARHACVPSLVASCSVCTLGDQSSSGEAAGIPRGISPAAATRVCLLPFFAGGYPRSACTRAILDMDIDDGHRFLPFFSVSFLCLMGQTVSSLFLFFRQRLPFAFPIRQQRSIASRFLEISATRERAWVTNLGSVGKMDRLEVLVTQQLAVSFFREGEQRILQRQLAWAAFVGRLVLGFVRHGDKVWWIRLVLTSFSAHRCHHTRGFVG